MRTKLPAKTHKDRGTFQPCRHSGPEPDVEIPPMPSGMSDKAKQAWEETTSELKEIGLISKIDQIPMRLLCDSYSTYLEAQENIVKNGVTVIHKKFGRDGDIENEVENPAIKIRDSAFQQIHKICREFGMTPSARTGITPSKEAPKSSNIMDFLSRN